MIVDKINKYLSEHKAEEDYNGLQLGQLASYAFKRQFADGEKEKTKALWLSQAGKCPKQVAYGYHGIEKKGKEIDSRAKIIFWQGDMTEVMLAELAKLAGCNIMATGLSQLTLSVNYEEGEVRGRPDGLLLTNGETYIVEFKSMSSYKFEAFERNIIDEEYIAQVNMYLYASGLHKAIIVAFNKDNGLLNERLIIRDGEIVRESLDVFRQVFESTPDNLPAPKFKADENGFYPWQCLYCSWWGHCIPDAEKVLSGKRYVLKSKHKNKEEVVNETNKKKD